MGTDPEGFGSSREQHVLGHVALVRVEYEREIEDPTWLERLASDWGAALLDDRGDFVFSLDSARNSLEFCHAVQAYRGPHPLFKRVWTAFGEDRSLGVSARVRRLENVIDRAWPGCVLGVGPVTAHLASLKLETARSCGKHRFEDLLPSEEIVSYAGVGFSKSGGFDFTGLDLYDHNLPLYFDSFVGRESLIDDVIGAASTARIVTLVGCGGSGKTRLSVHAAARLAVEGFDAIRIVRLAGCAKDAEVSGQVAIQSGIRSGRLEDFETAYRSRRVLLVLDNCEHVLSSVVDTVRGVTLECPAIQVVTTSREALDLGGEIVIEVPPLSIPPPNTQADIKLFGATELFCDRLLERVPTFKASGPSAAKVATICARLDGLPLALEHAAGQAASLGLDACVAGLETRFELLRSTRKDYEERHRTVWATINWSYELLDSDEQACLQTLACFTGAFSLSDAHQILSTDASDKETQRLLRSLVTKSMVARLMDTTGRAHFELLETVREFVRELAPQSAPETWDRHFAFTMAQISQAYDATEGQGDGVRYHDLQARYQDVRAVLARGVSERRQGTAEGLRQMSRFWIEFGPIRDGVELLKQFIETDPKDASITLGVLNAYAAMLWMDGQFDRARPAFENIVARSEDSGDWLNCANGHNNLGGLLAHLGQMEAAEGHFRSAFDLYLRVDESAKAAMCAVNFGHCLARQGKTSESIETLQMVLEELGALPPETEVVVLLNLSDALIQDGRRDEGLCAIHRLVTRCTSHGNLTTMPSALLRLCDVLKDQIEPGQLAKVFGIALQGFDEFGSADFSERVERRGKVEQALRGLLGDSAFDRHVASGRVLERHRRTEFVLSLLESALDTGHK